MFVRFKLTITQPSYHFPGDVRKLCNVLERGEKQDVKKIENSVIYEQSKKKKITQMIIEITNSGSNKEKSIKLIMRPSNLK
jgi:transcriptional regulator with GAF, ATPase, and Fis domain